MKTVYAEDVNYWKTGQSSPDAWIDRAKREIENVSGTIRSEAYGKDDSGRAAFLLEFSIGVERFRAVWPVLQTYSGRDERAARIQAATMLYHDIKAKCVAAKVHGARAAFFQYLMLPDGRTVPQAANAELTDLWPRLLTAGKEPSE